VSADEQEEDCVVVAVVVIRPEDGVATPPLREVGGCWFDVPWGVNEPPAPVLVPHCELGTGPPPGEGPWWGEEPVGWVLAGSCFI
jgi:hypothetical protein